MNITYNKKGKAVKMVPVSRRFFKWISTTGVSGWKGIAYNSVKDQRAVAELNIK